ncbi:MAG: hypothetical protein WBC77_00025 [Candidatus Zixiibacteriota bacterium]
MRKKSKLPPEAPDAPEAPEAPVKHHHSRKAKKNKNELQKAQNASIAGQTSAPHVCGRLRFILRIGRMDIKFIG